jgi:DNA-binding NarL/FixJ family response regulator
MEEVMPAKDNGYSEANALPGGIVMIDDDEVMHFLFRVLLKKYKPELNLQTYSEAKKVLRLLEDNSFQGSVIVLDLNMPLMNGWQFLQELERLGQRIPVYILSSSDNADDKSRASEFRNVKGYFVKPLNIEHINIIESGLGLNK